MDEQVKARLIGATVLVVIAVLLVPELLSGRKEVDAGATVEGHGTRGKRTYTIDLGGAVGAGSSVRPDTGTNEGPSKPRSVPPLPAPAGVSGTAATAPAGRSAPDDPGSRPAASSANPAAIAPPAAAGSTAATASTPVRQSVSPAAEKPVATKPAATGRGGGWAVQVGAFGSAGAARKLVDDLERDGLPAYVAPLQRDGKTLHRVRIGPVPSKAEAQQLATRVKSRKLPAAVVAAD